MKCDRSEGFYAILFDLLNPMALCKHNVKFCNFQFLYFKHDQYKNKGAVKGEMKGASLFGFRLCRIRIGVSRVKWSQHL